MPSRFQGGCLRPLRLLDKGAAKNRFLLTAKVFLPWYIFPGVQFPFSCRKGLAVLHGFFHKKTGGMPPSGFRIRLVKPVKWS
ncbi:hypothetical protein CXU22_06525 [Akkermansia muciniphila]|uniref:Uncharacterized protein n=1 Tax=Akkermansia muciniphila TaxID=239935 RepID=A0A2N8HE90_9BACT|nr:hypothetical protein CXU22_06525 [Akkermansia muciniphila]